MVIVEVELTDDEAVAFEAYVVYLQTLTVQTPAPFPPVIPVSNIKELVASFMTPPRNSMMQWYLTQ